MNLTKTAKVARVSIAGFFLSLTLFSIVYFSYPAIVKFINETFPKPTSPETIFGRIPRLAIDGVQVNLSNNPEYVLNTKDGRLPNITPDVVNVFEIVQPKKSFEAGKTAQRRAQSLFFSSTDLTSSLATNIYEWSDQALGRFMKANITAGTIDYSVEFQSLKPEDFNIGPQLGNENNLGFARSILATLGYFADPLYNRGTQDVTFGKFSPEGISETTTPQEYAVAKVDFFRTIYKSPIFGPRYDDGLLEVIYALPKKEQKLKFVKIIAHEWSVKTDSGKYGKYPPLSVQEAWKRITNNQGSFAKVKIRGFGEFTSDEPTIFSKIFIEDVSLGHYDSPDYQRYMQPIYIFKGTFQTNDGRTGEAVIYLPAVEDRYFE